MLNSMNYFTELDVTLPILETLIWAGAVSGVTGLLIMLSAILRRAAWKEPIGEENREADDRMVRVYVVGAAAVGVAALLIPSSAIIQMNHETTTYRAAQEAWFTENYDFKLNETQISYLFEGTTLARNAGPNGLPDDEEEAKETRDKQEKGEDDAKGPENTVLYKTSSGEYLELQMREVASDEGTGWLLFETGSKEPLPQS